MTDQLTPYAPTCEQLAEPLGIDAARPRLAWRLASARRGDAQTAYRVRVALDPADLADPTAAGAGRLLWDSGRVESAQNAGIRYGGPPLVSSTRYHWSVTVWDAAGQAAGSARSWFETALLHRAEWVARWIGRDPTAAGPMEPPAGVDDRTDRTRHLAPPAQLRRAFTLPAEPARARLYVTARGLYAATVNGVPAGDARLAPDWTEYHHRILYQTYDVTALLRPGENVLGAVLADGWWSGFVGFDARHHAQHYGSAPQLLAQLRVDFADGSHLVVASDGGWREHAGPIRYADLLMGEYVDARAVLDGWDRPGYDDARWVPALDLGEVGDLPALEAAAGPAVRVVAELPARAVHTTADGRTIADLGQNMVGVVRLTVRGAPAGTRIRLRHAETLTAGGEPYLANLRTAEATDVYLAGGAPAEVFEPRFTCHGFRYVEVTGHPVTAADVTGLVLATDTPPAGEFACSDPGVTRLESNIRWSQRGNFLSIPTDCPQRDERLGWLADAQIFLPTACRTADVSAFFARWMRDVVLGQRPDGAFADVAPRLLLDREGAPAWGDAGVIVPWHLYRAYGDTQVLADSFAAMTAWVDHVHRHNPDLVWRHRTGNAYGDWLEVDAATPREVVATAYFARSARLVALAARALGRPEAAQRYGDLHAAVRAAFQAAFVTADGRVHGGTQTGYLLALGFDLLPDHLVGPAFGHLVGDLEARGRHLTTGFIGVPLLCPVLTDHGRPDLAYALLHQTTYPSWGYSIAHGATTIWERWDGWTEERGFQAAAMNSFNHYSLGAVGEWLHGRVAGIDQEPGSVGYRRLLLRPTPGGNLTWATARYESPRGEVACGWRLAAGELHVEVTVPPGATARLHLPTSDPDLVRLDGAPPDSAEPLHAHLLALSLPSGQHGIRTPYQPAGASAATTTPPLRQRAAQ